MNNVKAVYLITIVVVCLLYKSVGYAQEVQEPKEQEFSWDVSIAFNLVNQNSILEGVDEVDDLDFFELGLLIDLYYKGFFIQTNKHRFGGDLDSAELGYELIVTDQYELDIVSKGYLAGFSESVYTSDGRKVVPELEGISERLDIDMQGLRYIRYFSNSVYWVDWAADLIESKHRGWVLDSFYSVVVEQRNWDINLAAGMSFYSSNMNNYYFSISPDEAAENRPVYDAGSGYRIQLEAFAQRPLSEKWMFKAGVTYSHYSASIGDSPLVVGQNNFRAKLGVVYVF